MSHSNLISYTKYYSNQVGNLYIAECEFSLHLILRTTFLPQSSHQLPRPWPWWKILLRTGALRDVYCRRINDAVWTRPCFLNMASQGCSSLTTEHKPCLSDVEFRGCSYKEDSKLIPSTSCFAKYLHCSAKPQPNNANMQMCPLFTPAGSWKCYTHTSLHFAGAQPQCSALS